VCVHIYRLTKVDDTPLLTVPVVIFHPTLYEPVAVYVSLVDAVVHVESEVAVTVTEETVNEYVPPAALGILTVVAVGAEPPLILNKYVSLVLLSLIIKYTPFAVAYKFTY
jgi:hypothetical protein